MLQKKAEALKALRKWGPRVDPKLIQEPSAKEPYRPTELRRPPNGRIYSRLFTQRVLFQVQDE